MIGVTLLYARLYVLALGRAFWFVVHRIGAASLAIRLRVSRLLRISLAYLINWRWSGGALVRAGIREAVQLLRYSQHPVRGTDIIVETP